MQSNDNNPAPKPVATFQFCDALFEALKPPTIEQRQSWADLEAAYMAEMRAARLAP